MTRAQDIRRTGAAALDPRTCVQPHRRFLEFGLKAWDAAAGALIR